MVYINKFVVAIKVNGSILRDTDSTVSIPFGSEYSLLIKNLHSVRAKVKVSVDGKDITEGVDLIVPANGSIDLERFIRAGNMAAGNKLKFIERTASIEEHRGIGAEDGLVRVEYFLEEQKPIQQTVVTHHEHVHRYRRPRPFWYPYYDTYPWYDDCYPTYTLGGGSLSGGIIGMANCDTAGNFFETTSFNANNAAPRPNFGQAQGKSSGAMGSAGSPMRKSAASSIIRSAQMNVSRAVNDAGITVPGGESNQQFTTAGWFPTESQSHVIVIKLRGVVAGKTVKKAITVKSKPKCETCGKVNKATEKFCGQCGTALTLI